MLVIGRRAGEIVHVGDDLEVRVLKSTTHKCLVEFASKGNANLHGEQVWLRTEPRQGQAVSVNLDLGNGVKMALMRATPRQVQLGFDAPPSVGVFRHEMWLDIMGNGRDDPENRTYETVKGDSQ
jgi:sRNA-binding carbon storage regulator CsrA